MNESNYEDTDVIPSQASLINCSNTNEHSPEPEPICDDEDENASIFSIRKIFKNLFVLSLALVLLFTAYTNVLTLQSSLNVEQNIGINSLIINTAFVIVRLFLLNISLLRTASIFVFLV